MNQYKLHQRYGLSESYKNISLNLNGTLNQEQCFNNCDLHINK